MTDKIYTVIECARMLKLNPETIRRFIRHGKIKAFRSSCGKKSSYRILQKEIDRIKNG